jgi:hypothetical protein
MQMPPWDTPHPQTIDITNNRDGNVIYETDQPLSDALVKLKKMIRDNVYT